MEEQPHQLSSRNKNRLFMLAIAGIAALALFFLAYSFLYQQGVSDLEAPLVSYDFGDGETDVVPLETNQSLGGAKAGDVAPPFTLLDLDDNEVSLAQFAGQPVIINFWATWCAPCRFEMPEFQTVYEAYEADQLVILALNQAEQPDLVREFFYDEFELTFTPLLDSGKETAVQYGAFRALPTTVFVRPDGIISHVHRGPLNVSLLEKFVDALLDPSPS